MEIRVKFDAALWFISALCFLIAASAVLIAYPLLWPWLGKNSSSIATWVQAFGAIAAIFATWYITSRQKRFEIDRESRLAALDGATMHAELWMAINSLEKAKNAAQQILDNRGAYLGVAKFQFNQLIKGVIIRPLKEQEKLVYVGSVYLSEIAEILYDFDMMKIGGDQIIELFSDDESIALDELYYLIYEIKSLQRKIRPVCGLLANFSGKYGVVLKNPKIDVEAFEDVLNNSIEK